MKWIACKYCGFVYDLPTNEQIEKLAYSKWEQANKPLNQSEFFWLQAETELTLCPLVKLYHENS